MKRTAGLFALLAVLLTACSGVPRTSRPQVVQTVSGGGDVTPGPNAGGPQPGETPLNIERQFRKQSILSTSAARQYLTVDAQRKWQPSPVVIVPNIIEENTVTANGTPKAIVVTTSSPTGQIEANGVFVPVLALKSAVAPEQPRPTLTYGLKKVDGQWRIDSPPTGSLIEEATFETAFGRPSPLYFFNLTEQKLIADQRYSALQGQELLSWLMAQLLAGPRPELASAVVPELPDKLDPARAPVTLGTPVRVEVPGVGQDDPNDRAKVAAELAYTLGRNTFAQIQLTDGGRPVSVPAANGDTFDSSDFPEVGPDSASGGGEFYLLRGQLVSGDDQKPAPGALGAVPGISSVAVHSDSAAKLEVAAVIAGKLMIGRSGSDYVAVTGAPAGVVSRPDFQPGTESAWVSIGNAAVLYRTVGSLLRPVVITPVRGAVPQGQIVQLRFSPDGARISAILQTATTKTLWVGTIISTALDVRVDSFEPITPSNLSVFDADWRDGSTLVIAAADPGIGGPQVSSIDSDGSALRPIPTSGLPKQPEAIAAGQGRLIVSVPDGTLWERTTNNDWHSLPGDNAAGTSPVFARSS